MGICDSFTSQVECVIQYNNLLTYKSIVLGLLFLYAVYILYKYRESWGDTDDMFDFFKTMLQKIMAYLTLFFAPLLALLFRHTVDFETFVLFIVGFYIAVIGLTVMLVLLFSWEKIKAMFGAKNINKYRESKKYGRGSKYGEND